MNASLDWLNHLASSWGGIMLQATWQASLVAVVLLGLEALLRRRPSPLRYGLLLIALLKFAIPPTLALPTGVCPALPKPFSDRPAVTSPFTVPPRAAAPPVMTEVALPEPLPQTASSTSVNPPGEIPVQALGVDRVAPAVPAARRVQTRLSGLAWLMLVHAVGVLVMGLWLLRQMRALARLMAQAVELRQGAAFELYAALSGQLGLRRQPRLMLLERGSAPVAFGVLRPVVLLPRQLLERLEPAQLRAVMGHELAHHRRRDPLVILFQLLLQVVWWFNPVFWLLASSIRKVREDCCDDLLLARELAISDTYCETLLRTGRELTHVLPAGAALGFAASIHPLARRLRRILDTRLKRVHRLSPAGALCVLALGCLLLPGQGAMTSQKPPGTPPPLTGNLNARAALARPALLDLLLHERWDEALRAGTPARITPPGSLQAEGAVRIGEPILLGFPQESQQWPRILPYPWLEFTRADGRLKAHLSFRTDSMPVARWQVRLELLAASGGPVVARAERRVTNTGHMEESGVPLAATDFAVLHFDLGPAGPLERAPLFRLGFERLGILTMRELKDALGRELALDEAIGGAAQPRQTALRGVRIDRHGDQLQATVSVRYPASPAGRWSVKLLLHDRQTTLGTPAQVTFDNRTARPGGPALLTGDFKLPLGEWSPRHEKEYATLHIWLDRMEEPAAPPTALRLTTRRPRARKPYPEALALRARVLGANDAPVSHSGIRLSLLRPAPPDVRPADLARHRYPQYWHDPRSGEIWVLEDLRFGISTGSFQCGALPPGIYRLAAVERIGSYEQGRFGVSEPLRLPPTAEAPLSLDVHLEEGSPLTIHVLDDATGTPPAGNSSVILLRGDGYPVSLGNQYPEVATDGQGICRFAALPAGDYTVEVRHRPPTGQYGRDETVSFDHDAVPVRVEAGRENELTVRLTPHHLSPEEIAARWPYCIEGRVIDGAGRPIAGARVELNQWIQPFGSFAVRKSDGDGRFCFRFGYSYPNWQWPQGIEPRGFRCMAEVERATRVYADHFFPVIATAHEPEWIPGFPGTHGPLLRPGGTYRHDLVISGVKGKSD